MSALHGRLGSLLQGVSQQPFRDRMPGQHTQQVNLHSDPVRGLRRRGGAELIPQTSGAQVPLPIETEPVEGTVAQFTELDGIDMLFWHNPGDPAPRLKEAMNPADGGGVTDRTIGGSTSYLNGPLVLAPVEDVIYVINTDVAPAMTDERPDVFMADTTIQFFGGNYGRRYQLIIKDADGTELFSFSYETPDGSQAEHVYFVSARALARIFYKALIESHAMDGFYFRSHYITGGSAGDPYAIGGMPGGASETNAAAWANKAVGFDGATSLPELWDAWAVGNSVWTDFWSQWTIGLSEEVIFLTPRSVNKKDANRKHYRWDYDVLLSDGDGGGTVLVNRKVVTGPDKLTRFAAKNQAVKVLPGGDNQTAYWMRFQPEVPSDVFAFDTYFVKAEVGPGEDPWTLDGLIHGEQAFSDGVNPSCPLIWRGGFSIIYGDEGSPANTHKTTALLYARWGSLASKPYKYWYDPAFPEYVLCTIEGRTSAVLIHQSIKNVREFTTTDVAIPTIDPIYYKALVSGTITWGGMIAAQQTFLTTCAGLSLFALGTSKTFAEIKAEGVANGPPPGPQELYGENVTPTNAGFGIPGVWVESSNPYEAHKLDPATMPRVLYKEAGTTYLDYGDWKPRQAGSNLGNPPPRFIGQPIKDASVFQSRLVLITHNGTFMSRTGRYDDFWFQSGTVSAEDDPIALFSTAKRQPRYSRVVAHDRDLVVFGPDAQFLIRGENPVNFRTATMLLASEFEVDTAVRPASLGSRLYAFRSIGDHTQVREFMQAPDTLGLDSISANSHCPDYIPKNVDFAAFAPHLGTAVVHSSEEPNKLFVYEQMILEGKKAQAAWHTWEFPGFASIHAVDVRGDWLHMVVQMDTGWYEARVNMKATRLDPLPFSVHLDGVVKLWNGPSSFYCPHVPFNAMNDFVVVSLTTGEVIHDFTPYQIGDEKWINLGSTAAGLHPDGVIGGWLCPSYITLTPPTSREADGRTPHVRGDITVSTVKVFFDETGPMRTVKAQKHRTPHVNGFEAVVLGSGYDVNGVRQLFTGEKVFGVGGQSKTLDFTLMSGLEIGQGHLPMTIDQIGWTGRGIQLHQSQFNREE